MDLTTRSAGLVLVLIVFSVRSGSSFNVEIDKAESMPGSDMSFVNYGTMRLTRSKNGRDFTFAGMFYVLKNLQDEELTYSLYRKNPVNKQFSPPPLAHHSGPICAIIKDDQFIYPDLLQHSNLPTPGTCPFPKGNYTIENYNWTEEQVKKFPKGEYKLALSLTKNQKFVTGFELLGTIS